MRVVHVVTRSQRRGAEIVAVELADALDALGNDDQLVALATAFDGGVEARLPPLVRSSRLRITTQLRAAWRLRALLDREPADVVVAHGGWAAQVCALALRRRHGARVWQRILDFPDQTWRGARLRYWRVVARRFDAAVVLSDALAIEMARLRFSGPVWHIPNARNPDRFDAVDRAAAGRRLRAELGLAPDDNVVGFVGHLVPQKQPELAVDTLAALHRDGCTAHLVVVGDGPLRGAVEQRVDDLGLRSSVTLAGHRDDTEWLYGGADLVLLTSASEGVPGVAIEAQMSGCPVVSFPVGSVADVVEDGVTGVVTARSDVDLLARATHELLANEALRVGMGIKGRARSADYSTSRTAAMYDQSMRRLRHEVHPA